MTFLPDPALIERLDGAVQAQRQRTCLREIPETVINPEPMLPWQIVTVLWTYERCHENPKPENNLQLADRACRIARLIHELHILTLSRIFPTVDNGTADIVDAAIVGKLAVRPLHPRELGRKFHRLGTENLKVRLRSLAEHGIVQENDGGRWSLQQFNAALFEDLTDHMSAESTISDNFQFTPLCGTASLESRQQAQGRTRGSSPPATPRRTMSARLAGGPPIPWPGLS